MIEHAYYVYAVARAVDNRAPYPLPPEGVVPLAPVYGLAHRALLAVISPVPLAEFEPSALKANLRNTDWAQACVLAHQRVLAALLDDYTFVPLKFCTLYHSEAAVQEMLARYYAALDAALQRLEGAAEWGVKLCCDDGALTAWVEASSDVLRTQREAIARASAGAGYFLRKKLEQAALAEAERVAASCTHVSHRRLAECARDVVINPVQSPQEHGHREEMILNGAYLVDDGRWGAFQATLATLEDAYASQGFRYELTGPWPPYNFARLELEEPTCESDPIV